MCKLIVCVTVLEWSSHQALGTKVGQWDKEMEKKLNF